MKSNIKYNQGFTLSELLVNIIIISTLSFSMMFLFSELQKDFDIETNRTEIIKKYVGTVR